MNSRAQEESCLLLYPGTVPPSATEYLAEGEEK